MGETQIVSVHKTRFMARMHERRIQKALNWHELYKNVPDWAQGVRVRKAGRFQYVVEATSWRGH